MLRVEKPAVPLGTMKPRIAPARPSSLGEPRPHDREVRDPAVGDPRLRAADDVVRTVAPSDRAHPAGIAAEIPLGQAEAADRVAGGHARQPRLLLLLRTVGPDRVHRERALHRHERPETRIAGFELEARQTVGDGARPRAAVAVQVHPEQAEVADLLDHRARERVVLEPLRDVRQHAIAHERADRVADEALVVGEQRVDPQESRSAKAPERVCGAFPGRRSCSCGGLRFARPQAPRRRNRAAPRRSSRPMRRMVVTGLVVLALAGTAVPAPSRRPTPRRPRRPAAGAGPGRMVPRRPARADVLPRGGDRRPEGTLRLAVADTEPRRERGLMGVAAVPAGQGMLFVFPDDADVRRDFWMKDTIAPLDMIFVRRDGTISTIAANVPATKRGTPDDGCRAPRRDRPLRDRARSGPRARRRSARRIPPHDSRDRRSLTLQGDVVGARAVHHRDRDRDAGRLTVAARGDQRQVDLGVGRRQAEHVGREHARPGARSDR